MTPVRFHPSVEADLLEATAYYDGRQKGLGDRFLSEFRTTAAKISEAGHVIRQTSGGYRHLKFNDFPYLVFFRDIDEGSLVLLVINAAREPALIQSLLSDRR